MKKEIYQEIKTDVVKNKKFNIYKGIVPGAEFGTDYYSECIIRLIKKDPEFIKVYSELAKRFNAGDYGTFYDSNELPIKNHEEAFYQTVWGNIQIKRRLNITIIFFPIERQF